jgi:hypothetical protein
MALACSSSAPYIFIIMTAVYHRESEFGTHTANTQRVAMHAADTFKYYNNPVGRPAGLAFGSAGWLRSGINY